MGEKINDFSDTAVNAGYKINENQTLSIYGRTDDHNTTGSNQTYKINFIQILGKFKFGATHSTGLRNPSLYELYGSDSFGIGGNAVSVIHFTVNDQGGAGGTDVSGGPFPCSQSTE